jgi:hypothetical protein
MAAAPPITSSRYGPVVAMSSTDGRNVIGTTAIRTSATALKTRRIPGRRSPRARARASPTASDRRIWRVT